MATCYLATALRRVTRRAAPGLRALVTRQVPAVSEGLQSARMRAARVHTCGYQHGNTTCGTRTDEKLATPAPLAVEVGDGGNIRIPFKVLYGSQTGTAHEFAMLLDEALTELGESEAMPSNVTLEVDVVDL